MEDAKFETSFEYFVFVNSVNAFIPINSLYLDSESTRSSFISNTIEVF